MKKSKYSRLYGIKYSIRDYFANNKTKLMICCLFCLVGLFTGIFTAFKLQSLGDEDILESFNVVYKIEDFENFSLNFFSRLLSYTLVLVLLFVFTFHPFLQVFGYLLVAYRSFLVTLNCVSFILIFSFSGIIKSILIIFPCQLLMILALIVFFCYLCDKIKENKLYACNKLQTIILPILICLIILSLLNLVETFLLFIFRSNVILVI